MRQENISEWSLGDKSVYIPCKRYCNKVNEYIKKSSGVAIPASILVGFGNIRGKVLGAGILSLYLLKSTRYKLQTLCLAQCREKAYLSQLKTEKDPEKRKKALVQLTKAKLKIAVTTAWLERKFEALKRKKRYSKYHKFHGVYQTIKRAK